MAQGTSKETFPIHGMTCINCERRIQRKLGSMDGVESARINYSRGTGTVVYDTKTVNRGDIIQTLEKMGYSASPSKQDGMNRTGNLAGIFLIVIAVYLILRHFDVFQIFNMFPQAETGMGYGMLFVIGLLTSVHCVAMCGGINLSQCIPAGANGGGAHALYPSLLYNSGRVISYTVVGAVVGAIGSAISFSGTAKGVVQIAAGVFMVMMGINMLGIFPWLRRITPRLPRFLANGTGLRSKGPFLAGLLNGLMPCGPLQAMQLYALSTGDPLRGALSMLLFSLGTVPLMFGLGALSSLLSKKFTGRIMAAGAVLVVVLGASMLQSGLSLSGFAAGQGASAPSSPVPAEDGIQIVETKLTYGRYEPITVASGIPVRWTITAEQGTVNGCNNRIIIPEYGIEKPLSVGENVIEFTPSRSGTFVYSCWMGMIRSSITVTENDDA